jgi:hypothetical protein
VIWCEITVDSGTQEAVSALIESGDTIPEDTDTLKYWLICEIFNLYPTGDFYHGIRQIQFEPIRRLGGTAETVAHPWKVVAGTDPDTWDVTGGFVFTCDQGLNVTVADTTLAGDEGDIVLTIERDYSTREVLGATLQLVPSADIASASYQSRIIASVGGTPNILQRQFEDIRIFEELIVVNGEFKLATYEMSFYENYDLPV